MSSIARGFGHLRGRTSPVLLLAVCRPSHPRWTEFVWTNHASFSRAELPSQLRLQRAGVLRQRVFSSRESGERFVILTCCFRRPLLDRDLQVTPERLHRDDDVTGSTTRGRLGVVSSPALWNNARRTRRRSDEAHKHGARRCEVSMSLTSPPKFCQGFAIHSSGFFFPG